MNDPYLRANPHNGWHHDIYAPLMFSIPENGGYKWPLE